MTITPTPISGVFLVEPQVFGDERGAFFETYNEDKFTALGLPTVWKQDNHSYSVKGVLRGLHFQLPPKAMAKIVRCTRGKIWDVAVDLRKDSPTYKQSFGVELSAKNKMMLCIPDGCAHGFYAMEDSEVLYKSSNTFDKNLDSNIAWNDPDLDVQWPVEGSPILSMRDNAAPKLADLSLPF